MKDEISLIKNIVEMVLNDKIKDASEIVKYLHKNYEEDENKLKNKHRYILHNLTYIIEKLVEYGYNDISSQLTRERQVISHKLWRERIKRDWRTLGFIPLIFKSIWNILTNYGTSPGRLFISALFTIYLYSFLHLALNYLSIIYTGIPAISLEPIYNVYSYLYISLLTFLPTGINTIITPYNGWAQLLISTEVVLGYFFIFSLIYLLFTRVKSGI